MPQCHLQYRAWQRTRRPSGDSALHIYETSKYQQRRPHWIYHHVTTGPSDTDSSLRCRLASTPDSTELSMKAARSLCAILEADAEALQEAKGAQEVISINLETPEHYCSPALWKARIHPG